MKFIIKTKGYVFSPFFLIVLMLLGVGMAIYFTNVDAGKTKAITEESKAAKNVLEPEGIKSALRNAILFAAYDAIDRINEPHEPGDNLETAEGLKNFLQKKIKTDLGNIHPSIISLPDVKIDYKQKTSGAETVRKDGFIVFAGGQGSQGEGRLEVEKYVDVGIFNYFDKIKNTETKFGDKLKEKMQCKFTSTTCYYDPSTKGNELLDPGKIFCTGQVTDKDYWHPIKDDEIVPGDDYLNAEYDIKRIEEGLREIALSQIKLRNIFEQGEDIVLGFNITWIDAKVEYSKDGFPEDPQHSIYDSSSAQCCHLDWGEDANDCVDDVYDFDYHTHLTISGTIHVKELYTIADATLKEDGTGYEICAKSPFMTSSGELKPMKYNQPDKEFDIKYSITYSYVDNCEYPDKPITPYAKKEYDPPFPDFTLDPDSMTLNNPVACRWGAMDQSYRANCPAILKSVSQKSCTCSGKQHFDGGPG